MALGRILRLICSSCLCVLGVTVLAQSALAGDFKELLLDTAVPIG